MTSPSFFAMLLILLSPPLIASLDVNNLLSPLLSPLIDEICKEVECGKGKCRASASSSLRFTCDCDSGWHQPLSQNDSRLGFLPCVVPNCTLDYSCSKPTPRFENKTNQSNFSIIDPCNWAYCGKGTCKKISGFNHSCICNSGYYNLLNATFLPCYSECTLGMDCSNLGITVSNTSASSTSLDSDGSSRASSVMREGFLWVFILLMIPSVMVL